MGRVRAGPGSAGNPFLSHRFLKALEDSKSVGRRTGWQPQYLLAETDDGTLQGAVPLYMKGHSQGEYVFDHAGRRPSSAPAAVIIPSSRLRCPSRRCRDAPVRPPGPFEDGVRDAMIDMLAKIAGDNRISSVHATFCTEADWKRFGEHGWLLRLGQQYHWHNDGYTCFDDFLAALGLTQAQGHPQGARGGPARGLTVRALTGAEIKPHHWDAFFAFYMDTGGRKWGSPISPVPSSTSWAPPWPTRWCWSWPRPTDGRSAAHST